MSAQQKLEFEEKSFTMADRLRAAAKRISQCEDGVVEGSTRVLQEAQVGVYADFAAFLVDVANRPDNFKDKPPSGRIVLPPRTGKTVIAGQIVSGAGMMTTVIVPTKTLVDQTAKELRAQLPNIPIGVFYGEAKELVMWGVNVTTYQILQRRLANGAIPPEIILSSLVFADEGHHSMTEERQKLLREAFDPLAVRVALTATPDYNEDRRLGVFFQHLIHEITISEAIELEMVAPLRVYMAEVDVDGSEVQMAGHDFDAEKLGHVMSAAPFFEAVRLWRYNDQNRGTSALICCVTQQQAYDLYKYLMDYRPEGTPEPQLILDKTKKRKREGILERFDDGRYDTIINVGVLIEGWNSRRCKLLMDLAPSGSWVRATQKFFRPMTKWDDREATVYMFLPKGLPELPILPMDILDWSVDDFEQGSLIASKRKRSEERGASKLKRTAHSPVKDVLLRSKIVFSGLFERPKLDPTASKQVLAVLRSNPLIKRERIPNYLDFRRLRFMHPLFKGLGANLLRYCKIWSKLEYVVFMARFFPEGASELYADRNYAGAWVEPDLGSCYDDLRHMRREHRQGRRRRWDGFEQGSLALQRCAVQECESAEETAIRLSILPSKVRRVLASLTPREERVIQLVFGIGYKEHTLEEAGKYFGVTRERIRQIEAKALRKLRHRFRSKNLVDFVS